MKQPATSTNGATNGASVATPAVVKKEKTETPNSGKTIHSLSSTSTNGATNGASVATPAVKKESTTPDSGKTIYSISSTSTNGTTSGASIATTPAVKKEKNEDMNETPGDGLAAKSPEVEGGKAVVDEDEVVENKGKRYMCSPLS